MEYIYNQITNYVFYGLGGNDKKSIFKITKDYKTLQILDWIAENQTYQEQCMFTIEYLTQQIGYSIKDSKSKIIKDIRKILATLEDLKIIKCTNGEDLGKVAFKKFIVLDIRKIIEKKGVEKVKYFQLYQNDKEDILNYSKEKVDNVKLLNYYCYLRSRMYWHTEKMETEMWTGGRAQVCFPSYETITRDTAIDNRTITKYNKILENNLKLIAIANPGKYYMAKDKNKITYESPNIYTMQEIRSHDHELKEGIKQYWFHFKNERVKAGKHIKNNKMKKANGYITRIEYLETLGKATEKQIERKDSLLESIENGNIEKTTEVIEEMQEEKSKVAEEKERIAKIKTENNDAVDRAIRQYQEQQIQKTKERNKINDDDFDEFLDSLDDKDEKVDFKKIAEESKKLNEQIEKRRNEKISMEEFNNMW